MPISIVRLPLVLLPFASLLLVSPAQSASLLDSVDAGRKDKAANELQEAQDKVATLCACFDTNSCKTSWSKESTGKSSQFIRQEQQLLSKRQQVCQDERRLSASPGHALPDIKQATAQTWAYREQLQRIDYSMEALSQDEIARKQARDEQAYRDALAGAETVDYPFATDQGANSDTDIYPFATDSSTDYYDEDYVDDYYDEDYDDPYYEDDTTDEDFWNSIQSMQNDTMDAINSGQMEAREARARLAELEARQQAQNNRAAATAGNRQGNSNSQSGPGYDSDCCYDVGLSDSTYGEALERAQAKAERVCARKGSGLVPVNLFNEQIAAAGWKYKARLDYQCGYEP